MQVNALGLLQGGEVVLNCEVLNLNNNHVVWKQGDRVIYAGNIMVKYILDNMKNRFMGRGGGVQYVP